MSEQVGSDYPGPSFRRYGEQWFECFICGFDHPIRESRRHYKFDRLVCSLCDDEKAHSDYMEDLDLPKEQTPDVEQPVSCQGEVLGTRWYTGRWYEGKWYDEKDVDCSGRKP